MTLSVAEFARRFLQHVLPKGFVRIRHYGLLANRGRQEKLRQCRRLLLVEAAAQQAALPAAQSRGKEPGRCPACEQGVMEVVGLVPAAPGVEQSQAAAPPDTS